jgi:hypothetical protein
MCKNGILLLSVVFVGAMGALWIPGDTRTAPAADTEIGALVERWVHMWNTYDLLLVDELFLADPRVSYFSSEKQGVIHGIEAVREHHRGFGFVPGGKSRGSRLWVEDVETDVIDGTAIVTGIWFFQRAGSGSEGLQRGPVTIVCIPHTDGLRIAHMHFATYLDKE